MARPQFSFSSPEEPPRKSRRGLLVGLVLAATVVAGCAYVIIYQPALVAPYLEGTPLEMAPTVTVAYKWRDAGGNWQLTGTPPPPGVEFEQITVNSKVNVMPLVPRDD